jgi:thymidylate synthase (FAD)
VSTEDVLEFARKLDEDRARVAEEDAREFNMCDCDKSPYIGRKEVHEHGHVVLEEMMGDELSIVNSARVSFNQESQTMDERNRGLINFLMRERHATPFERIVFTFDVRAPLFVVREWERHRLASYNEESARYSVIKEDFYVPRGEYVRSQHGKPGAYFFEAIEDPDLVLLTERLIENSQKLSFQTYHTLLEQGVAKEVARTVLPVGMYSRFKVTMNLRALLNFLSLRNHEHAQREIRDFAIAVEELVTEQLPFVMECWNTHGRNPI